MLKRILPQQMFTKQALGQLPFIGQTQLGIAGLFQYRVDPGDPSPDPFILYPVTGLPIIFHDLPRTAAALRVYLIENHVPAFGYAYMVFFYDPAGAFLPDQTRQKHREIAVYCRIYRAFYYICRDGP